ncbi:uncharacterized protein ACIQIH_010003 [Cyanocitta cristata]
MVKREWSNTVSKCALPIIPEYPGFQDVKSSRNYSGNPASNQIFQDLERGKSSSPQLTNFPRRASLVHCLGSSSGGCLKGHQTTSPGFQDKPLQEYFNERLMELGNYKSKRSKRKTKADQNQPPFLAQRGFQRRSSCSALLVLGPGKEDEESCSSANQHSKGVIECQDQKETQNVLKLNTGDFLDLLTMHITAPLEAFVQKK